MSLGPFKKIGHTLDTFNCLGKCWRMVGLVAIWYNKQKGRESKPCPIIGSSRKRVMSSSDHFSLNELDEGKSDQLMAIVNQLIASFWPCAGRVQPTCWEFIHHNNNSERLCHTPVPETLTLLIYFLHILYINGMKHILISNEQQGRVMSLVGAIGVVLTSPSV